MNPPIPTTEERDHGLDAIATNIKARESAEKLMEFVVDEAGMQPPRFWEVFAALVAEKLPPKPATVDRHTALTEAQAIWFEAQPMPYGKHAGEQVGCVPCDYLLYLTEGDDFGRLIRRYVKSKRFAERQE